MKMQIEETCPRAFALERAILIYRHGDETLAVEHSVREKKGVTPYLGPGRFVTRGVIEALLRVMNKGPLRYIPPNVVAISHRAIAWFEPASIRTMYFRPDRDAAVAAFDGKAVPQPPLLFVARERALRVFALAQNERPGLDTPLAVAPYWNVYGNHDDQVCLGSMIVPKSVEEDQTEAWTRAFFGSNFSHLNGAKRWAHPGTYAELLADAVAAGRFKAEWLRPAERTVGQVVDGKR